MNYIRLTRQQLVENLDTVNGHIRHYEGQLKMDIPPYYTQFNYAGSNKMDKWHRNLEIWSNCLRYWKRQNNRILARLTYANDWSLRKENFDLNKVEDASIADIKVWDANDFSDAYTEEAFYDGKKMTEDELVWLDENFPCFLRENIEKTLY